METSLTWLGRLVAAPQGAEWQRLSEVYAPLLARWAARAGVAASDRDDVVQEVLLVVIRRVAEFEHQQPGAFRAWLRSILALRLKKYFREHRSFVADFDLDSLADPQSQFGVELDREHNTFVTKRLLKIIQNDFSRTTWAAFCRQVLDGVSPSAVAAELNLTLNAVVLARSRVMKRLRQEAGQWCE